MLQILVLFLISPGLFGVAGKKFFLFKILRGRRGRGGGFKFFYRWDNWTRWNLHPDGHFQRVWKGGNLSIDFASVKSPRNKGYVLWTTTEGRVYSDNDLPILYNRPLALRGYATNAFLKQWVGILLMLKIDRANKNYLTPEIGEETHLRQI